MLFGCGRRQLLFSGVPLGREEGLGMPGKIPLDSNKDIRRPSDGLPLGRIGKEFSPKSKGQIGRPSIAYFGGGEGFEGV